MQVFTEDGSKIDRVELYLAYEQCHDCPSGVGWPGARSRPAGNIYYLKDEARVSAELQGDGTFALHLTAEPGYTDPPWVAVVGFVGDKPTAIKILRDVHIPRTRVDVWKVYLHPATLASEDVSSAAPSPTYRALAWRRAPTSELPDPAGCVAYQKYDNDGWTTEYFVPESDPDCDGLEPECSPYWFAFNKDRLPASCVTASDTLLPGVCRVGITLCADGQTSSAACSDNVASPGLFCVPGEVCASCDASIPVESCIGQTLGATDSRAPYATCPFTYDDTSVDKMPCSNSVHEATLSIPAMGSLCTAVAFHTLADPLANPSGELKLGIQTQTVFQVRLGLAHDPCEIKITWQQGSATPIVNGVRALLEVGYETGNRVLYPVELHATAGITCPAGTTIATTCTTESPTTTPESMWRCVTP